jgi:hypothetical protein
MYPYYALFDERRREEDEQRFWFWNSMHFPLPRRSTTTETSLPVIPAR